MKVEIDVDKLCELKDRIRILERDVCRKAAENAELACERPSGDKFRKLTDERDWWRERAVFFAKSYDSIRGDMKRAVGNRGLEVMDDLEAAAMDRGYEVPE